MILPSKCSSMALYHIEKLLYPLFTLYSKPQCNYSPTGSPRSSGSPILPFYNPSEKKSLTTSSRRFAPSTIKHRLDFILFIFCYGKKKVQFGFGLYTVILKQKGEYFLKGKDKTLSWSTFGLGGPESFIFPHSEVKIGSALFRVFTENILNARVF